MYNALRRRVTIPEVAIHPLETQMASVGLCCLARRPCPAPGPDRAAVPDPTGERYPGRPHRARPARHWPCGTPINNGALSGHLARPDQWARGGGGTPHAHRGNGRAGGPGWRRCRVSAAPSRGCPDLSLSPPLARPLPHVLPAGLRGPGAGRERAGLRGGRARARAVRASAGGGCPA